jgi:hypothetical protein
MQDFNATPDGKIAAVVWRSTGRSEVLVGGINAEDWSYMLDLRDLLWFILRRMDTTSFRGMSVTGCLL